MVGAPRREATVDGIAYVATLHKLRPLEVDAPDQVALSELTEYTLAKVVRKHPAEAAAKACAGGRRRWHRPAERGAGQRIHLAV